MERASRAGVVSRYRAGNKPTEPEVAATQQTDLLGRLTNLLAGLSHRVRAYALMRKPLERVDVV